MVEDRSSIADCCFVVRKFYLHALKDHCKEMNNNATTVGVNVILTMVFEGKNVVILNQRVLTNTSLTHTHTHTHTYTTHSQRWYNTCLK